MQNIMYILQTAFVNLVLNGVRNVLIAIQANVQHVVVDIIKQVQVVLVVKKQNMVGQIA